MNKFFWHSLQVPVFIRFDEGTATNRCLETCNEYPQEIMSDVDLKTQDLNSPEKALEW